MTKRKLTRISLSLILPMLLLLGCEISQTKSNSGSSSNSGTPTQDQPAHGQATVSLLQQDLFRGTNLNTTYWTFLEGYCKAGPTQLIIANMDLIPSHMDRAGFVAPENQQYYALASTYAGLNWSPGDATSQALWDAQDQMYAWWNRYIQEVVRIMQKYPQTTAVIIINDGADRLGARLGPAIYDHMGSVANRVQLGDIRP
jgi:hypothetical protein